MRELDTLMIQMQVPIREGEHDVRPPFTPKCSGILYDIVGKIFLSLIAYALLPYILGGFPLICTEIIHSQRRNM